MAAFKSRLFTAGASTLLFGAGVLPVAVCAVDSPSSTTLPIKSSASAPKEDNSPYAKQAIDHYNSAVDLQQQGSYDQAVKEYEQAIVQDNRLYQAWCNLADIYAIQKNYTKAGLAYEKSLSLRPDRPYTLNGYGRVLYRQGKYPKAREKWEKAIAVNPRFAPPYYNLAQMYEDQGDFANAVRQYETFVKLSPGDKDGSTKLAAAKQKLGAGAASNSVRAGETLSDAANKAANEAISAKEMSHSVSFPGEELVPQDPNQEADATKGKGQGDAKQSASGDKTSKRPSFLRGLRDSKKANGTKSANKTAASDSGSHGTGSDLQGTNQSVDATSAANGQSAQIAGAEKTANVANAADAASAPAIASISPAAEPKKPASTRDKGTTSDAARTIAPFPPPFKLATLSVLDNLTQAFKNDASWRGADGAASVPLSASRSLWLFGDTFVRTQGAKSRSAMINNTAGWLGRESFDFKFFFREADDDPVSLVSPEEQSKWYWPDDGFMLDGRLFVLYKKIVANKKTPAEFGFDWIGDDLVMIDKPQVPPDQWTVHRTALPDGPNLLMGAGCLVTNAYVYIYTTVPSLADQLCPHPIGLARTSRHNMFHLNAESWEYLCDDAKGGKSWQKTASHPAILFKDGAAEITISKLSGEPYYVATYMPPLSSDICLRFARQPEGPWSLPLKVYTCKESEIKVLNKNVMVYSAKDHPELSMNRDEMVITYCVNPGVLEQQNKRPDLYFPRALSVTLEPLK